MLKGKKSKMISLVLALSVAATVFTACGTKSADKTTKTAEQTIRYNIGADPKTIDPGLNSSVEGGTVDVNAFEGLTNIDSNEKVVPGVAEKWDVSTDGLTYTFHLRTTAKWSDGKAVTAKDFEYAWKRALDPAVASDYAYQLFYLKNGEKFNSKKASKDDVGVKAKDDTTLVVTLESPVPYILSLFAFPTYMPLREDVVSAHPDDWSTKADTFICNGPFKMKEWLPKDKIVFVKNDNYWNKDKIKLTTIEYKLLDNETSYMTAFTSGQLDFIESPPSEQIPTLVSNGTAKIYPYLGTYYYSFNIASDAAKINPAVAKVLKDVKVRKAIQLAIDRKVLVENVTKGGQKPATSFVPAGIKDADGTDFKKKDYYPASGDVAQAKQLLAEAGFPDGKGFPSIEIMYNSGQGHQDIATAVQEMLKKNLGITVTLRNVERKVQLDETSNKKYPALARNGWIADYADPMTFLDMWTTTSGNNVSGYSSAEYDKLIAQAKTEADSTKRMTLMHQAEDLLMTDMPIIPLYEYTNVVCLKSYVKGVHKSPLGMVYFNNTYIENH